MIIDPEQIAAVITEIAESQIMARFGELAPDEVREKSSKTDLVTVVDEATEKELAKALRGIYPAAEVIGEEGVAASPGADRALDGDGAFWIVDPLDGTRNFVRGKREFGTIVALAVNGETRMGWIYGAPDGLSVVAEKGSGVSINNEKLASPTPAAENSQKPVGMKSAYWLKDEWRNRIPQNLDDKFAVKAGHCSAYS
ncbi:MAG: inositol monophosphatase family protein, partial [Pseudomonadota bacterium]